MNTSTGINNFQRSGKLDEKQRQFLSQFTIDLDVQRLIPSSTVGESVRISPTTAGLLLTHQPLTTRFYLFSPYQDSDYCRVSDFVSGRRGGFVRILPSDYDYDLTHTLYYVPAGSVERDISTSDLTVPGVELVGAYAFERDEMSVFLEEVIRFCGEPGRENTKTASITGAGDIVEWLRLESPRRDYLERTGIIVNRLDEKAHVGSLREKYSLHLDSPRDTWIRQVGVDWPEYFFGRGR